MGCHLGSAILSFKLPQNRWRWLPVGVFVLSSSLNFLDRGLLQGLATAIEQEFHFDDQGYGFLVGAFSLAYALSAPATGYLLDRFGLNCAATMLVGWWSAISVLTGATWTHGQLLACRIGLGVGESGGIPAVAKMGAIYLPSEERALGSALGQVGITIGSVLALSVGVKLGEQYGWRFPFFLTGLIGLLWIPLWWLVLSGNKPELPVTQRGESPLDRRLVVLMIANVMWMTIYSLWTNWTSLYLQRVHHLTLGETTHYAWIPSLASNLGGFLGGWLALRWIGQGRAPISARIRVILLSALGGLFTLLVPLAPGPGWGIAAISLSFFWTLAGSVNVYTIPIDLYGAERAGRAISALVFAYGILQTFISPLIGKMVMSTGYGPVCWMVALPPLLAWALLRWQFSKVN